VERARGLVDRSLGDAEETIDLADRGLVAEILEPRAGVLEDLAADGVFEAEQHAAQAEERLRASRGVTEVVEGARCRLEALAGLLEEPASEERLAGLERVPGERTALLHRKHGDDLALATNGPVRLET